ncbi:MAG: hypothetical protein MI755_16450 [Sphingomonadales bacterium]|nr:hypothetical protein [Sphingomonadales bacterium]
MTTRMEKEAIRHFDHFRDQGYTSSDPADQIEHLLEEVGEFVGAVLKGDELEAVMEAGDVAWLLVDILHVLGSHGSLSAGMAMSLDKLIDRHGYVPEGERS